jgi:hypothetical protein
MSNQTDKALLAEYYKLEQEIAESDYSEASLRKFYDRFGGTKPSTIIEAAQRLAKQEERERILELIKERRNEYLSERRVEGEFVITKEAAIKELDMIVDKLESITI